MNAFTIKDLENLSGIKAHTIRIWEQRYNFLKPQRTETNIRLYSNEELRTLLNIALLNKYGFKISHIDRMNPAEINDKILSLAHIQAQQERIVNELIGHMIYLNLEEFEAVLDNYIMTKGIEKSITQIIFPFLERIGILWLTNHINPAQEHLVTNVIRQKLIVGIESTHSHLQLNKTALLFLPEGEHHELGLLFMYYLMKSRGVKIYYLGANVPIKDMAYVVQVKQPDLMYTHLTSVTHHFNLEKMLHHIHKEMPQIPVIISGQLVQQYKKKVPDNICFKKSLTEVMEYIATIGKTE
ncbi:MAG: MerR family transcriptional regulator [Hydrotalea flava]|uniref:MerR family transcriptional regulator n=1 Tax=Hydrotalea sp. TaxID=2881279 RepID=UPI0009432AC8|nr:MerR family transcriptional regulator [Hydrotalea sp.]NIM34375.1 MerR family transcriptional regulator [Hydrotalea flava]NIM37201.1 MerR family transcriptional regulator [Hydrotalea flava]NIN02394.1 MerR family transcriptional regulator [Hydrotalea flava]NIN14046.1 MerR family transcriptional regulator [Hydrotalea flava]NIO93127.1 MerR family transcriptional regulator [Hydrotalea flava]